MLQLLQTSPLVFGVFLAVHLLYFHSKDICRCPKSLAWVVVIAASPIGFRYLWQHAAFSCIMLPMLALLCIRLLTAVYLHNHLRCISHPISNKRGRNIKAAAHPSWPNYIFQTVLPTSVAVAVVRWALLQLIAMSIAHILVSTALMACLCLLALLCKQLVHSLCCHMRFRMAALSQQPKVSVRKMRQLKRESQAALKAVAAAAKEAAATVAEKAEKGAAGEAIVISA